MKAVVYDGPRTVSVKEVPDARIERPTDALVRITTTNICGSDRHMYDGRNGDFVEHVPGRQHLSVCRSGLREEGVAPTVRSSG